MSGPMKMTRAGTVGTELRDIMPGKGKVKTEELRCWVQSRGRTVVVGATKVVAEALSVVQLQEQKRKTSSSERVG
jgi:hypothetical protein